MKRIKYFLVAFATLVTVSMVTSSCNSFLDVRPEGELVEAGMFDTQQGIEDALYGAYSSLTTPELYARNCYYLINDARANYFTTNSSLPYYLTRGDYTNTSVIAGIDNVWTNMYKSIGYANNIIDNIKDNDIAKEFRLYNVYYAEALAMRAFLHFEVSRYFCENILNNPDARGIPYKTSYDFSVAAIDKLSVTYEKVIADLKMAEELYGNKDYYDDAEEGEEEEELFIKDRIMQFNLYAVRALLARVYWTMGDLANASEYALKVINDGRSTLISDYNELSTFVGGILSEKETILGFFSNTAYEYPRSNFFYEKNNSGYCTLVNYEDIYMTDKDDTMIEYRYEKWFFEPFNFMGETGVRCMKIVDPTWINYESIQNTREYYAIEGINIIRLPELYYIVSEYYLSINDQTNAKHYLDEVIVTRGLTGFAERGVDISLEIINNERRKEYICEGQFFYVMKKYNMDYYDNLTDQYLPASNEFYVFDLPSSEVDYREE